MNLIIASKPRTNRAGFLLFLFEKIFSMFSPSDLVKHAHALAVFASAAQRNFAALTVNFYKNPLRVLSGGISVLLLIIIKEISLK